MQQEARKSILVTVCQPKKGLKSWQILLKHHLMKHFRNLQIRRPIQVYILQRLLSLLVNKVKNTTADGLLICYL